MQGTTSFAGKNIAVGGDAYNGIAVSLGNWTVSQTLAASNVSAGTRVGALEDQIVIGKITYKSAP
jgi:hypothetical protein